ncbi:hypothetical protein [Pedobacter xixiisoli]|uniref:Uncharacterized protein n=1 Tax=Pedobacter xixiisoli TaxID=1476464 RepID=A0A285ZW59_9SPHI|nr:hypothetical protein [Pedobacter xixiisoli]SOD13866.1 hypothetical protein SAMN06297358_1282 [Pedobacter xixiisoli]
MSNSLFSKSKIDGLKKFQESTLWEWENSFVDNFKPRQKITYSEGTDWIDATILTSRLWDYLNKYTGPFTKQVVWDWDKGFYSIVDIPLSEQGGVLEVKRLTFLEVLALVAALYSRLSKRLRSISRQIGQEERKLESLVRDKRACFRAIVRMLFKNLDDEHDTVNNFQDNARAGYLKLKQYHGHQIYRGAAFKIGGIAA